MDERMDGGVISELSWDFLPLRGTLRTPCESSSVLSHPVPVHRVETRPTTPHIPSEPRNSRAHPILPPPPPSVPKTSPSRLLLRAQHPPPLRKHVRKQGIKPRHVAREHDPQAPRVLFVQLPRGPDGAVDEPGLARDADGVEDKKSVVSAWHGR